MKGRRFDTIEEIQEESQRVLDTIPKRDFQGCFQAWQKRWDRCIRAKGTILKVVEEFNIQGKQISFYKYCPGTFGYTLVLTNMKRTTASNRKFKVYRRIELELSLNLCNWLLYSRKSLTVPFRKKMEVFFNTSDLMATVFVHTYFYFYLKPQHRAISTLHNLLVFYTFVCLI